jgi:hypothetical protein
MLAAGGPRWPVAIAACAPRNGMPFLSRTAWTRSRIVIWSFVRVAEVAIASEVDGKLILDCFGDVVEYLEWMGAGAASPVHTPVRMDQIAAYILVRIAAGDAAEPAAD